MDAAGNLYGTTSAGGTSKAGTVYQLSPDGTGGWTEKVLYSFLDNSKDGKSPFGKLLMDSAGDLFGATTEGGINGVGTVYELKFKSGQWSDRVLHSFNNVGGDGSFPSSALVVGPNGGLYGATSSGGAFGLGTIYELKQAAGGSWLERVLHSFNNDGTDGINPEGDLTVDAAGNLVGAARAGGAGSVGMVFQMKLKSGVWTEDLLYSFVDNGRDGKQPNGGMVLDAAGNVYGTTQTGGTGSGRGIVFELSQGSGAWIETVLHNFASNGDGIAPVTGLIMDATGNLYGTTDFGGTTNSGVIYEVTP
jgi:uncharacterized repeat protein (TIGR03803 family)